LLAAVGCVLLVWQTKNPLHSLRSEGLQLLGGGAVVTGVIVMVWRWRKLRWAALAIILAGAGLFALPGRAINIPELRGLYLGNLRSFVGTPYVWGGESRRGVDCSGLARQAWREALFTEGLKTLNGRELRLALAQWCTDASARELATGARGTTAAVYGETTAASVDPSQLQPGDFAVTTSGVHLLVFLGGAEWIEADPDLGTVLILEACCDDNPWLAKPVRIYRWKALS
jgi:hypothetical protein